MMLACPKLMSHTTLAFAYLHAKRVGCETILHLTLGSLFTDYFRWLGLISTIVHSKHQDASDQKLDGGKGSWLQTLFKQPSYRWLSTDKDWMPVIKRWPYGRLLV